MAKASERDAVRILNGFAIPGRFTSLHTLKRGLIHDTFVSEFGAASGRARYVHQRINTDVFRDPVALMANVARVTAHVRHKVAMRLGKSESDPAVLRRVLTLVPTVDGRLHHLDDEGGCWRTYRFIEGSRSFDRPRSATQACEAARAFGLFQRELSDLPPPRLTETIPGFHDTPKRMRVLEAAANAGSAGRLAEARPELAFARKREDLASVLTTAARRGQIPERIAHNDTKLNNVLMDDRNGDALCVIDLDTVMPGLVLHDFGDLVRSAANPAHEDASNPEAASVSLPHFGALVRGYLAATRGFLTSAERALLVDAAMVITLEIGVRFLTDFLEGDVYFAVDHPRHNLQRCRTQFRLLETMEREQARMRGLVQECAEREDERPAASGA